MGMCADRLALCQSYALSRAKYLRVKECQKLNAAKWAGLRRHALAFTVAILVDRRSVKMALRVLVLKWRARHVVMTVAPLAMKEKQVFWRVVKSVPIDVMNNL